MEDRLIIGTACDDKVRVLCTTTTNLVNTAAKLHNCSAVSAAALGRMLTAGSIMGCMLKSDSDSVTIKIDGGGPAKGVIVTAHPDGSVKGYIGNPYVEIPYKDNGKLDVGGAVGKKGNLQVIRDIGLKEPYIGQVPIVSGEIGDDLTYYFAASEQTPSAVGVGVLVNKDLSISSAGGFIIQMLPDSDELEADLITYRLNEIGSVTSLMEKGLDSEEIAKYIFEGMDLKIIGEKSPSFKCECSRERVEKALISIGRYELEDIYKDNKTEELKCNFCNTSYLFTHEQIGELLKRI